MILVARINTGIFLAILLIVEGLSLWFQSIVYRAYIYTREDEIHLIPPSSTCGMDKCCGGGGTEENHREGGGGGLIN
jgi:hypothetical protein